MNASTARKNDFRPPDARAIALTNAFLNAIKDGPNHPDLFEKGIGKNAHYRLTHKFLERNNLLPIAESVFPDPVMNMIRYYETGGYSESTDVNRYLLYSKTFHALLTVPFFRGVQVVDEIDASTLSVSRFHEPNCKKVVVQPPTHLDWSGNGINSVEAANADNRPDRFVAVCEHICLIRLLVQNGTDVLIVRPRPEWPEGVYTRDISFVIGDKLIRANMAMDVRKPEQDAIKNAIVLPEGIIEGGNVFVDSPNVLIGVGDRTDYAAVKCLQTILGKDFQVIPLELKPGVLHLDCVFNPVHKGAAVIDKNAFLRESDVKTLENIYADLVELPKKEIELLATNFISMGSLFVNTHCKNLVKSLNQLGHWTKHLAFGEILKADGSARCATLPLA
ncbi:MAG: arginine deiminase family protein [Candidatus Micrarchaeota archaeon]|nr:arginine deiminase family protein [Candidatus Micrarchaeota archaeon]